MPFALHCPNVFPFGFAFLELKLVVCEQTLANQNNRTSFNLSRQSDAKPMALLLFISMEIPALSIGCAFLSLPRNDQKGLDWRKLNLTELKREIEGKGRIRWTTYFDWLCEFFCQNLQLIRYSCDVELTCESVNKNFKNKLLKANGAVWFVSNRSDLEHFLLFSAW